MRRSLRQRLLEMPLTLALVLASSFLVIRLAPGSPFKGDRQVSAAVIAQLEATYGLDAPVLLQLGRYARALVTLDLGPSLKYPGRSVSEIIAAAAPATLTIAILALLWALLFGVGLGVVAASRHGSVIDRAATLLTAIGISVPTFVVGPLLVVLFAFTFPLLPPAGWGTGRHVLLPALTLGTAYAGTFARLTRAGFLEVARSDYVLMARAKGMPERIVVLRHMLRPGLLPLLGYLGPAVAHLAVGSIVVEKLFAVPGLGSYLVDGAINRDYFLVMGIVLLEAVVLLGASLAADTARELLDPRLRQPRYRAEGR